MASTHPAALRFEEVSRARRCNGARTQNAIAAKQQSDFPMPWSSIAWSATTASRKVTIGYPTPTKLQTRDGPHTRRLIRSLKISEASLRMLKVEARTRAILKRLCRGFCGCLDSVLLISGTREERATRPT